MNNELMTIIEEVFFPYWQSSGHPCHACVERGLRKAYALGLRHAKKTAEEKIEALMILKSQLRNEEGEER